MSCHMPSCIIIYRTTEGAIFVGGVWSYPGLALMLHRNVRPPHARVSCYVVHLGLELVLDEFSRASDLQLEDALVLYVKVSSIFPSPSAEHTSTYAFVQGVGVCLAVLH